MFFECEGMDAITLLLYMFFGFILVVIILVGIFFLKALFGAHTASRSQTISKVAKETRTQEEDDQTDKDTKEDSEGDGLMLFDDPMFPPEFEDNDNA